MYVYIHYAAVTYIYIYIYIYRYTHGAQVDGYTYVCTLYSFNVPHATLGHTYLFTLWRTGGTTASPPRCKRLLRGRGGGFARARACESELRVSESV